MAQRPSSFQLRAVLAPVPLLSLLSALGCFAYCWFLWQDLNPYWFHPGWTSDDSLQQLFPFYKALDPDIFRGDLITKMMEQYLPPIHYWLGVLLTRATGSPIMAGHWLTLIQIVLTCLGVFGAVRYLAGTPAAFFAVTWFLHSRPLVQRISGGLPRGWGPVVLSSFLYFVIRGSHRAVLVTLFLGCLLHPPGTLIAAFGYGLYLVWKVFWASSRPQFRRPFIEYLVTGPLLVATVLAVVRMPDDIGTMATYDVAAGMPEFSYPHGRFPFVPHRSVQEELQVYGYQAFVSRLYNTDRCWKRNLPYVMLVLFFGLTLVGVKRKLVVIPSSLWFFLISTAVVYAASREFAFRLYVPNRHLQFPLALFTIIALTSATWRAFFHGALAGIPGGHAADTGRYNSNYKLRSVWLSVLGLAVLAGFIVAGGGNGLQGSGNYNYSLTKRGNVFVWMQEKTPRDALFAGEPTHIDGIQLLGQRKALATTETAHPFYDHYYAEIKRRLIITLKAHYARTLSELVSLLEPEGVDYFVFERRRFYPEMLKNSEYFEPLNALVKELTSRDPMDYAYRELPREDDPGDYPYIAFRDRASVVVDIHLLKEYLKTSVQ